MLGFCRCLLFHLPTVKRFCLLILDDDVVTSVSLARAMQDEMPDAQVLRAGSLYEARLVLASFEVDFFLIDVRLPDGNGIDFILDITTKDPTAGVVITTADPMPKYRDQASAFGALHFFEKPVAPRTLGQIMRNHRAARFGATPGSDTSFSASLTRLTVMDVIQLKCLSRATLRLDLTLRDGRHGSLYFSDGEITHAEAAMGPTNAEVKSGQPALVEILTWRAGKIEEVRDCELPASTINTPWQALLLNAAQQADEHP